MPPTITMARKRWCIWIMCWESRVPGDGQPRTLEWMELLHKIQAAGKGLWLYDWTAEEIKRHFKELKPEKLVFSVDVASEDEAVELLDYLKDHM